ncbi:hypothetical protein [Nostocoides sp. Soil756]|uniref:hypothetical protein n=1 Tax=Nostocoides sp. Soil756 TaxID=1736399 RepID=UPI000AB877E4|nr:hypothetical protein [Tetrasphaera sp. Soil756]
MSASRTTRSATRARAVDPGVARRRAELWRATGLGFSLVWVVVLALVVAFWVRVTFLPRPGDDLPGALEIVMAPVALLSAGLAAWVTACAWRLWRRRASGWDAVMVVGAFAIAVAVFIWAPGRFLDGAERAPRPILATMVALGVASIVTGRRAQRAFVRAAVGPEPSDDLFLGDDGPLH